MGQTDPGQVFRDAADIIREHGWKNHSPNHYGPGYCILAAVAVAKGQSADDWAQNRAEAGHLARVVNEQYGTGFELPVYVWNDIQAEHVGGAEAVLAVLEKAATSAPVDL